MFIAASGPVVSLLVAGALFSIWAATAPLDGLLGALRASAWWLAAGNALLAVLNLVPSYPLDGGRLVRAVAWAITGDAGRAMELATMAGRGFAYATMAVGIYLAVVGELLYGVWLLVLGVLLNQAARFHQRRVEVGRLVSGLTVDDLMERNVAVVGPGLTLDTLYEQHRRSGEADVYPVTAQGALVGSINIQQVLQVPRTSWPNTRVNDVMTRADRLHPMTGKTTAYDALMRFDRTRSDAIPVVDEGDARRLVGLVTRGALLDKLRAHAQRVRDQQERARDRPQGDI
jgi:CBS domain-containing protein